MQTKKLRVDLRFLAFCVSLTLTRPSASRQNFYDLSCDLIRRYVSARVGRLFFAYFFVALAVRLRVLMACALWSALCARLGAVCAARRHVCDLRFAQYLFLSHSETRMFYFLAVQIAAYCCWLVVVTAQAMKPADAAALNQTLTGLGCWQSSNCGVPGVDPVGCNANGSVTNL